MHGTPNKASELFNALTDAQFDGFQDDNLHIFSQVKTMLRQGLADFGDDDLADQREALALDQCGLLVRGRVLD